MRTPLAPDWYMTAQVTTLAEQEQNQRSSLDLWRSTQDIQAMTMRTITTIGLLFPPAKK